MSNKDQHLRVKFNQYVFQRRWPRAIADQKPSKYKVVNLGTANLIEARMMRDQLVLEMDREAFDASQADANRSAVYQRASPEEREVLDQLWSQEADDRWQSGKVSVAEAVEQYKVWTGQRTPIMTNVERWIGESGVGTSQAKANRKALERFAAWSPVETVERVDRALAGRWIAHLLEQGLSNRSVNVLVGAANSYWSWMLKRGIIDTASSWSDQRLPDKPSQKRVPWTTEEIVHLINRANTKLLRHLCWFGPLSGMRASEVASLRTEDCRDGFMTIREGKTEAAARRVPVHHLLEPVLAARRDNELVFPEFGGVGRYLSKRFGAFLDDVYPDRHQAGKRQSEKVWHSYRHWASDQMLKAGCEPYVVSQILGHSLSNQNQTLATYFHGSPDETLRAAIETLKIPVE